jgi:hypothetical protein
MQGKISGQEFSWETRRARSVSASLGSRVADVVSVDDIHHREVRVPLSRAERGSFNAFELAACSKTTSRTTVAWQRERGIDIEAFKEQGNTGLSRLRVTFGAIRCARITSWKLG